LDSVIQHWLRLEIPDDSLKTLLHNAFCEQLEEGLVLKEDWFANDDKDGFLQVLQGSKVELEAVSILLDVLDGGVRVDAAGEAHWLASEVVRMADDNAHSLLRATWGKCGLDILEEMFDLTGDAADDIYEQQLNSRKAFSGFLRNLDEKQSSVRMMKKFPYESELLPSPLDFADLLIKRAHSEGVGKTTTMARKSGDGRKSSMGWAWVCVHGKDEGEAWHYEPSVRDLGGDWVPALKSLWEASKNVINDGDGDEYVEAMESLRNITGTMESLPKLNS